MKHVKVSDVSELWDLVLEGMGTGIFAPPFFKVSVVNILHRIIF